MANRFARANGNFTHNIWSTTAGGAVGASIPTVGDNAIINSYTVTVTGNVVCDGVFGSNLGGATASGNVILTNGSSLTCMASGIYGSNVTGSGGDNTVVTGTGNRFVTFSEAGTALITAKIIEGSSLVTAGGNCVVSCEGVSSVLNIVVDQIISGNTLAGYSVWSPVIQCANGTTNITCSNINNPGLNSDGRNRTILNFSTMNITGGVTGGLNTTNGRGTIFNSSAGLLSIVGNVQAELGSIAIGNEGTLRVIGIIAAINNRHAISGTGNLRISGNILNAPNGTAAIYAPSYRIDPVPANSYIRYARNGTGVGSDAYLFQFTTDSLSAFSMPPVSAVRSGVTFANATLTGTCVIPNPSSVSFGVPVDNTVGTAVMNASDVFNVSVTSLTATGSLGNRLRNSATLQGVGGLLASFTNN